MILQRIQSSFLGLGIFCISYLSKKETGGVQKYPVEFFSGKSLASFVLFTTCCLSSPVSHKVPMPSVCWDFSLLLLPHSSSLVHLLLSWNVQQCRKGQIIPLSGPKEKMQGLRPPKGTELGWSHFCTPKKVAWLTPVPFIAVCSWGMAIGSTPNPRSHSPIFSLLKQCRSMPMGFWYLPSPLNSSSAADSTFYRCRGRFWLLTNKNERRGLLESWAKFFPAVLLLSSGVLHFGRFIWKPSILGKLTSIL